MSLSPARSFSQEYFNSAYRDYNRQNPRGKMLFYKNLVENAAGCGPLRLLEAGCAFGSFLSFTDASWTRIGFDISEYALQTAKRRAPGAAVIAADAAHPPFTCSVDVIVAFDSLEHVGNLECVAEGFKSMLSSRGYFIFVVPVYDGPTGPVIRLLDQDRTHIHKKPRDFWLEWAKTHFEVCEWMGIFRYLFPAGVYLHYVTKTLRRCAPAIAVVARKST
jgi:SAM-dependent methyltransferase